MITLHCDIEAVASACFSPKMNRRFAVVETECSNPHTDLLHIDPEISRGPATPQPGVVLVQHVLYSSVLSVSAFNR